MFRKTHSVSGVLFLTYISIALDPTEQRHPACTRHATAVAKLIQKTAHIVMGHPLTVLTTHSVQAYIASAAFTMTLLRQTRMEKVLSTPHTTYTHKGINMADQMEEGDPQTCAEKVRKEEKVGPDLETEPLTQTEETLFTGGCCFRHPHEGVKAAYAVVRKTETEFEEVETGRLEDKQ